jgi:hypothetical protein
MATFKTKPRGDQASFVTDCHCGGELTISNGRIDPHQCREKRPITLADLRAALDNR